MTRTDDTSLPPPGPVPSHDLRLPLDLARLARQTAARRRALGWIAGAAGLALTGCGGGSDETSSTTDTGSTGTGTTGTTTGSTATGTVSSCSTIPEETAGPYPGDGSNTSGGAVANALALSGIVRSDIRTSIAGASAVADGVPLSVELRLVNSGAACADLAGYAVYLWHCDAQGRYSMYSSGVTAENYLRGVQVTDAQGVATFQTVFPGCYSGRMPHIHFEVYRSATSASLYTNKLRTSQLAFPTAPCSEVYAGHAAYAASVRNFAAISFASDNVFSDGVGLQLATVSGNVVDGYRASLTVGIAA